MPALTKAQRLLILSVKPGEVSAPLAHPSPAWLVEECIALGLVERIGRTSAWRLTEAGVAARDAVIDS